MVEGKRSNRSNQAVLRSLYLFLLIFSFKLLSSLSLVALRLPLRQVQAGRILIGSTTLWSDLTLTTAQPFPQPTLTVVIPAYNEESRIEPTLRSYIQYFAERARCDSISQRQTDHASNRRWSNHNVTIIVVDDGSTDATAQTVQRVAQESFMDPCSASMAQSRCHVLCLPQSHNQGKGAAIAAALEHINSTLVLMADADGSADVRSLDGLYDALLHMMGEGSSSGSNSADGKNDATTLQRTAGSEGATGTAGTTVSAAATAALVCGYRTYSDTAMGRRLFRWGFRTTVRTLCGNLGVRDSQCGFKLMTTTAYRQLYRNLHLTKWSHDVEVLYRAKLLAVSVTEAPVQWQDKEGSKLTAEGVIKVASRMFADVVQCRIAYELGWWTV